MSGEILSEAEARFRRADRLLRPSEFSRVFTARRVIRGRFFSVHWSPNDLGRPRLGLVVAKKLVRRAHQRNLVKRIARETFRLEKSRLPACDVVVRLSAPIAEATRRMLREDLLSCFERLVREAGKCAAS